MIRQQFAQPLAVHIRLLDNGLILAFREVRRVQRAKKAGARERIEELRGNVELLDGMRRQCEVLLGQLIPGRRTVEDAPHRLGP